MKKDKKIPSLLSGILLWLLGLTVLAMIVSHLRRPPIISIPYSRFWIEKERKNIKKIILTEKEVLGEFRSPIKFYNFSYQQFKTRFPFEDKVIIEQLIKDNVIVEVKSPVTIWSKIWPLLPVLLVIIFWITILNRASGVPKKTLTFGQSRAKMYAGKSEKVTFDDVAGCDEAKEELKEIVEFLKSPSKFERLGAKIPKGVLLLGAPGTGKTLLARATAGEAGVPFFSISGSDFVELFVGVGASRVRDLFEKAKKNRPCIVFIDELDAVGRYRGAGIGGGHDEREQTLNALLVEMDGFEANKGIIVMSATNRPDVLDPALLRPGRFDRRIVIDKPDIKGREEIFKIHLRKVPIDKKVDLKILARGTPGFSGADIENMINEAALLAAKREKNKVGMQEFEEARDKVLMGRERRSLVLSETEHRNIAYHEAGHALVSKYVKETDPIHKVSIIPRGMALGITQLLPLDERKNYSKEYCLSQLIVICGGRAAEQVALNTVTTGGHNDIENATKLARKMVCEWGMSEEIGPIALGDRKEEIFLGREIAQRRDYSEETAKKIDKEVVKLVREAEQQAIEIIKKHRKGLEKLVKELLKKEVLTGEEVDKILGIKKKRKK